MNDNSPDTWFIDAWESALYKIGSLAGWLPIMVLAGLVIYNLPNLRPAYAEPEQAQITIMDILLYEEGYRSEPYLDSEGYVTIGIGHKLVNLKGIEPSWLILEMSKEEAMSRLTKKIARIRVKLNTGPYQEVFNNLSSARQAMIISMAYQMGVKGLYKFKKMWGALYLGCYAIAAEEALNSKWAKKQSKKRAERQAEVLRTGQLINYEMEIGK